MESEANEQIVAFVTALCNTDRGLVMAANMLDSCTGKPPLLDATFFRDILSECAKLFSAGGTASGCRKIVDEVAAGRGPSGRSYLRAAGRSRPSEDDPHHVYNVMKCESFHRFHLSTRYKEEDPLAEVLPLIPNDSPSAEEEYRSLLARITSERGWANDGAKLGRTFPSPVNCWLSTDRFGPDDEAPILYGDDEAATRARDELGLVDYDKDSCLNQIRFPEAALAKLPDIETARPVFSDCGTSRFMVRLQTARATKYAEAGWGTTVHLGKMRADPKGSVTGAPERVALPLRVDQIWPVEINFLGRVRKPPNDTNDGNPEEAFRDLVLGTRAKSQIVEGLLDLIDGDTI